MKVSRGRLPQIDRHSLSFLPSHGSYGIARFIRNTRSSGQVPGRSSAPPPLQPT
jgi:hypothetical protein